MLHRRISELSPEFVFFSLHDWDVKACCPDSYAYSILCHTDFYEKLHFYMEIECKMIIIYIDMVILFNR